MDDQEEDLGGYATRRLAQAWQVDPEWYAPADGGFRWWGYRLEQQATAENGDEGGLVLRTATTVLRNVPDQDAAVRLIAEVNQRSGTFALCYEHAGRRVVAVSTAWMAGWYEPTYRWFSYAALLQLCQAENWADALAAELGAEVAVSEHPQSGRRHEPDEMVDSINYYRSRPEWVIGSFEFSPILEQLAGQIQAGYDLTRGEGADELDVWGTGYSFPLYEARHTQLPFRARFECGTWHPDLGPGAAVQLTAPLQLGESAAELVNRLNGSPPAARCVLMGAWWADDGQIGFTGFLPQALMAGLPNKFSDDRDEQLDIYDSFARLTFLGQKDRLSAALEERDTAVADAEPPEPTLGRSAFLDGLLRADWPQIIEFAAETAADWVPGQPAPEPVDIPDLIRVDPDGFWGLAVFGTFNPMGPTLNVLGTCQLADGRHLLANWMRHPFSPQYTALFVMPDLEPATVRAALDVVLPDLGIGIATEFAAVYAPEALKAVVGEAFQHAAVHSAELEDLWAEADVLENYAGNPWSRMSGGGTAGSPLPDDPTDVVSRWWDAVTDGSNFGGHLVFFGQAWDGAIKFVKES